MAMFRALSTRRSGGYDRLLDETKNDPAAGDSDQVVLKRSTSVPGRMLFGSSSKKPSAESGYTPNNSKSKQKQGKKDRKAHPVFSLFEGRWNKKKITANPDFSRYIEYLKEGGVLNKETDSPVVYNK